MFEVETHIEPPMKVDPQIENLAVFQQRWKRLSAYLTQGFDGQLSAGVVLQEFCDTARERFGNLGEDEIRRLEADSSNEWTDSPWIASLRHKILRKYERRPEVL